MSKLKPCKACGKEISKNSKLCIHCGEKNGKSTLHKVSTGVTLFLIFFIILGIAVGNSYEVDMSLSSSEYKNSSKIIDYDTLAREPDKYIDEKVFFTGQIIQIQESGSNIVLRVNVTEGDFGIYKDTIWVNYRYSENEKKLLEYDIIDLWGEVRGIKTYTAVLGNKISVPELDVRIIERVE